MSEAMNRFKNSAWKGMEMEYWRCDKLSKNLAKICFEWRKRFCVLIDYLAYYSEFANDKIGGKIIDSCKRRRISTDMIERKLGLNS